MDPTNTWIKHKEIQKSQHLATEKRMNILQESPVYCIQTSILLSEYRPWYPSLRQEQVRLGEELGQAADHLNNR